MHSFMHLKIQIRMLSDVTHITARSDNVAFSVLNPIVDVFFSATKNGNLF